MERGNTCSVGSRIKRAGRVHIDSNVTGAVDCNILNRCDFTSSVCTNIVTRSTCAVNIIAGIYCSNQHSHSDFIAGVAGQKDALHAGFACRRFGSVVIGQAALQNAVSSQAGVFEHEHDVQEIPVTIAHAGITGAGCCSQCMQRVMRNAVCRRDRPGIGSQLAVHRSV